MKPSIFLSLLIACLLISNTVCSQTGESKFKMVIVNSNEKKIAHLYPAFGISSLSYTDANMNRQLDGTENGAISFYVKNTGTILLQKLNIVLDIADSIRGISYNKTLNVDQINIGDSSLVNIPLTTDDKLGDGMAQFKISVKDIQSDSLRIAQLDIPTRALVKLPDFAWITPSTVLNSTDFSIAEITGLIKSKSNITGLKLFVNGQVIDDNKSFEVLATENPNEYRIRRTITLNDGDNEIKIEAKNTQGAITSEPRTINYFVQKIDENYVEKRLALVIGNANYLNSNALQNPVNDANAIAKALKEVGFTVLLYTNTDLRTMKKVVDDFGEKLSKYTVGLFYYAGHGMQVGGNNYLVPVDASMKVEQDVDYDCVNAGQLLGKMEAAGTGTNIIILDACRDNPFARSWSSRSAGKGGSGLAFMNAPSGSIVAYATAPGKTASDGTGKNGLYTEALLKYIKVPSLSLEDFFKNVRVEVENKSNKSQVTWEASSLKGTFFFKLK